MIGSITGKVSNLGIDWAIINTEGGVGYLVSATTTTLAKYPTGTSITLFTHLVVREDQLSLYGFETTAELHFFQQLLSVSGVGPRVALAILNSGKLESLQTAIGKNDVAILTTISGVGRKTAERIMIELKNKLGPISSTSEATDTEELLAALTQLGYNAYEVRRVVVDIPVELNTTEDRIKYALKLLAK